MKSPLLTLGLYPCTGSAVVSCATGNTGSLQSRTIAAPGLNACPPASHHISLQRRSNFTQPLIELPVKTRGQSIDLAQPPEAVQINLPDSSAHKPENDPPP